MPKHEDSRPWRHLYNSGAWKRGRLIHLRAHPLCVMCKAEKPPRYTPATVVDHIRRHGGNTTLFLNAKNWQSLCKPHHDGMKAAIERAQDSPRQSFGEDGWPIT